LGIAITELENNALGWGKIAKDGAGFKAEGFSAFATSAQGVATTSPTKVQLDGEEYDSSSRFDLSNDRFTPQLKGAYEVTGCVGFFTSASAAQGADLRLYKNGVLHSVLAKYGKLDAGCGYGLSGVAQVEMNGSSDYLELFVVPTTASLMNLGQLFSSDDNASIATYKATRFAAKLLGRTT
ncbi:MAG: hypothetical protein JHC87_09360, partial [Thermoleophilaceae bacterium]|nr:hypothetical protein [Thermoleophilaceae bacterium]